MKALYLTTICLLLTACGQEPNKDLVREDELNLYAVAFASDIGVPTDYVELKFGVLEAPTIGMCYSWSNGDRSIVIDGDEWSTMTDLGKEALMYHELGHCALGLDHDNSTVVTPDSYTIYGSIMNQYWFGHAWFYEEYRDLYKQALKNHTLISF